MASNNKDLLIGGRPITFSQWEKKGIHYLGDIFDVHGLCSFQDLKDYFDLPGTSLFFYLQPRAALKAHGVPWQYPLPTHPIHELFITRRGSRGLVSSIYQYIMVNSYKDLSIDRVWRNYIPDLVQDFDVGDSAHNHPYYASE